MTEVARGEHPTGRRRRPATITKRRPDDDQRMVICTEGVLYVNEGASTPSTTYAVLVRKSNEHERAVRHQGGPFLHCQTRFSILQAKDTLIERDFLHTCEIRNYLNTWFGPTRCARWVLEHKEASLPMLLKCYGHGEC